MYLHHLFNEDLNTFSMNTGNHALSIDVGHGCRVENIINNYYKTKNHLVTFLQ